MRSRRKKSLRRGTAVKILLVTDNLLEKARLAPRWRRGGAEVCFQKEGVPPDLVVVDLAASDAAPRIRRVRQVFPGVRCLAFGSHVDKAAFAAAREAGATEAVSRGAVAERVARIVLEATGGTREER